MIVHYRPNSVPHGGGGILARERSGNGEVAH
jgi:hypothetical protein